MNFAKTATVTNINSVATRKAIDLVNKELEILGDETRIAFFCQTYLGEFIGMTADGEKVGMVEAWVEDGHQDHPFSGFAVHTYADPICLIEPITLMVQL